MYKHLEINEEGNATNKTYDITANVEPKREVYSDKCLHLKGRKFKIKN